MHNRLPLSWNLANISQDKKGTSLTWVPATVPGAVQLDWAKANSQSFPENAQDLSFYDSIENDSWIYESRFSKPHLTMDQTLWICFKGIDYCFDIQINGRIIHSQEGMYTPVELPLYHDLLEKENIINVILRPPPFSHRQSRDRSQANQSCKPPVSYGWDFHPRLIPLGIWDEAYLEIRENSFIREADLSSEIDVDRKTAAVKILVNLFNPDERMWLRWSFFDPQGKKIFTTQFKVSASETGSVQEIDEIDFWWPNGYGKQPLYTSCLELVNREGNIISEYSKKMGFRKIRLVMSPNQWDDASIKSIPTGPNKPPITLEINGQILFMKGSNWVGPDIFPGRWNEDSYRKLLIRAKDAGFNILRCWGGAGIQKESFFDLCDEMGLLIWQEFPLACNRYEDTKKYMEILDKESKAIITKLKNKTCLALWCGGNELFNSWSKMTEQDGALRLLNRNCFDLDPSRPFLMTSPLYGMGHGQYLFKIEDGRDVFQYIQTAHCTAYTEFGIGSAANLEIVKSLVPATPAGKFLEHNSWKLRHGLGAWDGSANSWLNPEILEHYFGQTDNLEETVLRSQLLQGEGLKAIFEEARRQKPYASMALNWCFNEPWPALANTSILCWPSSPKSAYFQVQQACRPLLYSAKIEKFSWKKGETFQTELWLLNDSLVEADAFKISVIISQGNYSFLIGAWEVLAPTKANENMRGPLLTFPLNALQKGMFELRIESPSNPELSSSYKLILTENQGI